MERNNNVSIIVGASLSSGFMGAINKAKNSFSGFSKAIKSVRTESNTLTKSISALNAKLTDLSAQRMALFGKLAKTAGLAAAFSLPIKSAMDFEDAMADVRKVVDFKSPAGFKKLQDDLLSLSRTIPLSANELAQITASGGQLGVKEEDLTHFTTIVAKMSTAFDMSAEEAGVAMGTLSNVFQIPITQLTELGDVINVLGNNTNAKERAIVAGLTRAGGVVRQFGLSAKQASAYVGTLIAMGQAPEEAGTATAAMLQRLQIANKLGQKVAVAFAKLGLSEQEFPRMIAKDPQGALLKFFEAAEKVDPNKRTEIFYDIFGRNYSKTAAILTGSLAEYKRQLGLVSNEEATSGAMEREYLERMKTFKNSVSLFKNSVNELKIAAGTPLLEDLGIITKKITEYVHVVTDWSKKNSEFFKKLAKGFGIFFSLKIGSILAKLGLNYLRTGFLRLSKGILTVVAAANKLRLLMFGGPLRLLFFAGLTGWLVYSNWDRISKIIKNVVGDVGKLGKRLKEVDFGELFSKLETKYPKMREFKQETLSFITQIKNSIKELDYDFSRLFSKVTVSSSDKKYHASMAGGSGWLSGLLLGAGKLSNLMNGARATTNTLKEVGLVGKSLAGLAVAGKVLGKSGILLGEIGILIFSVGDGMSKFFGMLNRGADFLKSSLPFYSRLKLIFVDIKKIITPLTQRITILNEGVGLPAVSANKLTRLQKFMNLLRRLSFSIQRIFILTKFRFLGVGKGFLSLFLNSFKLIGSLISPFLKFFSIIRSVGVTIMAFIPSLGVLAKWGVLFLGTFARVGKFLSTGKLGFFLKLNWWIALISSSMQILNISLEGVINGIKNLYSEFEKGGIEGAFKYVESAFKNYDFFANLKTGWENFKKEIETSDWVAWLNKSSLGTGFVNFFNELWAKVPSFSEIFDEKFFKGLNFTKENGFGAAFEKIDWKKVMVDLLEGAWNAIKNVFIALRHIFKPIITGLLEMVWNAAIGIFEFLGDILGDIWDACVDYINGIFDEFKITDSVITAWEKVKSFFVTFLNTITEKWEAFKKSISSVFGENSFIGKTYSKVKGTIGSLFDFSGNKTSIADKLWSPKNQNSVNDNRNYTINVTAPAGTDPRQMANLVRDNISSIPTYSGVLYDKFAY